MRIFAISLNLVSILLIVGRITCDGCPLGCLNGGVCVNYNGLAFCACPGHFSGSFCQNAPPKTPTNCNLPCVNSKINWL